MSRDKSILEINIDKNIKITTLTGEINIISRYEKGSILVIGLCVGRVRSE